MGIVRFGTFEVHLATAELFRQGRPVHLQQQPFEVLRALLEHPGELVTRDMLRRRLWPDDVTVAFDQSLNKSITKLRDALGDRAASPRFIETLPKRGYRFIAPLSAVHLELPQASDSGHSAAPPQAESILTLDAASREETTARRGDAVARLHVVADAPVAPNARGRAHTASALSWLGALLVIASLALWLRTSPPSSASASAIPDDGGPATPIFAARDALDRGHVALVRRSDESLRLSATHFERALALSPRLAAAHLGLAESWSLMGSRGLAEPHEAMTRTRESANRALALDRSAARAYAVLARTAMLFDLDWRTAAWQFAAAVREQPGDAVIHEWFSAYWSAAGEHERAVAEAQRAVAAEPLSSPAGTSLATTYYFARQHAAAAAAVTRVLDTDPDFAPARRLLALVHAAQGHHAETVLALERLARSTAASPAARVELAWGLAVAGDHPAARRLLADLDRQRGSSYVPPEAIALVHVALRADDQALAWLERAVFERSAGVAFLLVDPRWDRLRQDPRLAGFLARIRPDS